jgi:chromate transporter
LDKRTIYPDQLRTTLKTRLQKHKVKDSIRVTRSELFLIFLKAGLAFGGGLGILAVLEDELVSKRRAVTREEFLTIYGVGRIVPSGTMTALAVAYGYKFGGMPGTVIALLALSLPVFVLTIVLTIAYVRLYWLIEAQAAFQRLGRSLRLFRAPT